MDLLIIIHLRSVLSASSPRPAAHGSQERDHEDIQKEADTDQRLSDFYTARISKTAAPPAAVSTCNMASAA